MSYLSYTKSFQGVGDVFLNNPKRYLPFIQLLSNMMDTDSDLTKAEREMIAMDVSHANACHYCVDSHCAVLNKLGENLNATEAAQLINQVDEKMKAMLLFSRALTNDPEKINQNEIKLLLEKGWSEQAIEDAIGVISTFAFLNRLVDGLGIKGSDEHFAQVSGMVSQHGYGPLVQMVQQKAGKIQE